LSSGVYCRGCGAVASAPQVDIPSALGLGRRHIPFFGEESTLYHTHANTHDRHHHPLTLNRLTAMVAYLRPLFF
jgi:hypothetical protein